MSIIKNESLQGIQKVIDLFKQLKTEVKGVVTESQKITKALDIKTSKGLKELDNQIKDVNQARKIAIDLEKEEARLSKEVANAQKAEAQALKAKNQVNVQVRREQERQVKEAKKLKAAAEGLTGAYSRESKRLNTLRKRYKDLILAEGGATNATRKLKNEIQQLDIKLKKVDADVGQFQRSVGNYKSALAGSLGTVGQFATGAGAIAASVMLVGKAIGSAVEIIKGFEQAGANLKAVLGDLATDGNISKLTEDAKRLGASTAFSATEVRGLQVEFAKLGFNPDSIVNATEATLNLAAATGSDLAEAAAIAGGTLGGFGLAADQTARVTDVMAKSFSISALDLEKFSESMKNVAPAAKAVGLSVEETTALLGTLSKANITGSKAGSNLATGFINLKARGIDLQKALKNIKKSADPLSTAVDLVGKNAAKSFLVLAEGTEITKEYAEALNDASGAAKDMADIQLDTLDGSLKILNSSWEGLILSMEDGSGVMNDISKTIVNDLAAGLSVISGESKEAKEQFSLFGIILTAIKQQFNVMVGAIKLLTVPWRIIISLAKKLGERFGFLKGNVNLLTDAFNFLTLIINNLPEITDVVIDQLIKALMRISDVVFGLVLVFQGYFQGVKSGFSTLIELAKDYSSIIANIFNPEEAAKSFQKFKETLINGFGDIANNAALNEGIDKIKNAFTGGFDDLGSDLKDKIIDVFARSSEASEASNEAGKDLADEFKDGLKDGLFATDEDELKLEKVAVTLDIQASANEELEKARDEAFQIIKKARDEIAKDEEERRKKAEEQRKEDIQNALAGITAILNAQKKASEEREKSIENEIKASEKRSSDLRKLAETENEDVKKNLAFEQKQRAELELARQKEIQKQKFQELAITAVQTYKANAQNDPDTALVKTIGDLTLLSAAIKGISGSFFTGSEMIENDLNPSLKTGRDDYLVRVDGKERVMTGAQNNLVGNMSNDSLAQLAYASRTGELAQQSGQAIVIEQKRWQSNDELIREFKAVGEKLDSLPSRMPHDELLINKLMQHMDHIHKIDNKTTKTRYQT